MDAKIIASWVAFLGTLIIAAISIWQNYLIRKDTKKAENRKRIQTEKLGYEEKLKKFYIPLRTYLENSKTLYKIFRKNKPQDFRVLTYLLNPEQLYDGKKVMLSTSDRAILDKVFEIGKKIEKLIYESSYLIGDDKEFIQKYIPREEYSHLPYEKDMTILSLLVSHIIVIRLAYNSKLIDADWKTFESFVFPNEVNIRVDEKIDYLKKKTGECEGKIIVSIG
ncbi:hypothetical protein [uncultured Aquimarina sp.]|uniref:hypothetical protein n=1 Tax=uncultured Aquimarina sp. TaxID=575652 RepID=UPI00261DA9B3|nr:hypothetical protein [uncultured Aquimarina sp.]